MARFSVVEELFLRAGWLGALIVIGVLSLNGCATPGIARGMALSSESRTFDNAGKSLVLATLTITEQIDRGTKPYAQQIAFTKKGTSESALLFEIGEPAGFGADFAERYLISVQLDPGSYSLDGIFVSSKGTGKWLGRGYVPLNYKLYVVPGSVVYLGHIYATRRLRNGNEQSAAVGGGWLGGGGATADPLDIKNYKKSTFDVRIHDRSQDDITEFRQHYPVVTEMKVVKAILPPWKRPPP